MRKKSSSFFFSFFQTLFSLLLKWLVFIAAKITLILKQFNYLSICPKAWLNSETSLRKQSVSLLVMQEAYVAEISFAAKKHDKAFGSGHKCFLLSVPK